MAEKANAAKGWTDTEKFGLLIQIIEKAGSIPWDDLTLPEGRTKKGCSVMIDREKQKLKKAREVGGETTGGGGDDLGAEDDGGATKPGSKRKATGEASKPKAPSKKKAKVTAADDGIDAVKAEVDEDE